jgi:dGTPase
MNLPCTTAEREAFLLASYAMHSGDSRGRKYSEREQNYRGPFQRDRDRIVHSTAFRRLSGKMQVFTGDMGDYHRTRLTHTQEVASIARTLGRALRLNEDLIEALALFHDLGHPPFGHAGEDALNSCLVEHGGFSHNRQAIVVVEQLEHPYANFTGLNLTYEVLESQASRIRKDRTILAPLLEAQVVEAADSATYDAHDADDAIKLGLVSIDDLQENRLMRQVITTVRTEYTCDNDDILRRAVVHELIDLQVRDVLQITAPYLLACEGMTSADLWQHAYRIGPSAEIREQKIELEKFLYQRVYRHPRLMEVRERAQSRIHEMFHGYLKRMELLPPFFQQRAETCGPERSVGDYIGCMTDRFCDQQFAAHFCHSIGG